MIYETGKQPHPGESKCFTVAIGNFPMPWQRRKWKQAVKVMDYIKDLDGFLGIHPLPPKGTLLIFRTVNDAKAAKNVLVAKGVIVGENICEIFVNNQDLPGELQ